MLDVAARETAGLTLRETKARLRHDHDHVRVAAGDVLAFAAVTLQRCQRLSLGLVTDGMTVTAACDFHEVLSEVPATLKLNLQLGKSSAFCLFIMGAIIRAFLRFPDANAK
jgi:hypothetical protein